MFGEDAVDFRRVAEVGAVLALPEELVEHLGHGWELGLVGGGGGGGGELWGVRISGEKFPGIDEGEVGGVGGGSRGFGEPVVEEGAKVDGRH